jgi:hypothetical protein
MWNVNVKAHGDTFQENLKSLNFIAQVLKLLFFEKEIGPVSSIVSI